ncbi:MAG: GrpB family protein [Alphaproteobacteria bacterium]|nr:GrpB family protein [Alphaproteobacteria bacterium]
MTKKLSEMTLEELWALFPIFLTEHKDYWENWYQEEYSFLKTFLPLEVQITHIGSTAIKDIWAKPIIDILIEIPHSFDIFKIKDLFVTHGYICMSEETKRISFNKGYTEQGFAERVFHIHVRYVGDNDEIKFRDYLNAHPNKAKEYETLKLQLWKKFEHNRDNYTQAKTDFIKKILSE